MKLLGFITGMMLMGGLGMWYMQTASRPWPSLTEAAAPTRTASSLEFTSRTPEEAHDKQALLPEKMPPPLSQERLALQESESDPEDIPENSTPEEVLEEEHPSSTEEAPAPPPQARPTLQLSSPSAQESAPAAPASIQPLPESLTLATDSLPKPSDTEPAWQAFWEPFQTELSARGFAQRLRETTGLNIKVDKQAVSTYLVLFPYTSEKERQYHIELIEDRTSLKLKLLEMP